MKAKSKMLLVIRCLFLLNFFFLIDSVSAQESKKTIFSVLTSQDCPKITLETDFTTLMANKKTLDYIPATILTAEGKSYMAEIRTRGKFRRKNCEVPPIKIKFKKKMLNTEGLDTLNEMKLVMPCFDSREGDEMIIKEYLAYRMLEHMTSASFRARLIKLTLIDTHVEKKRTMFAILLEDVEEVAARLNGTLVEGFGMPMDSMITNQAALVVMFEYMIGNTDWDISMQRNVRFIQSLSTNKLLVIPYDFDFSGIVSAPYASPSSESGLKSVRERFMMSNGLKTETLQRATNQLLSARNEFEKICRNKNLSNNASEEMIKYLDSFFQQAEQSNVMPSIMKAPSTD